MLNTDGVSDDLVQAAKAAAELEPAVQAFAEATGSLEPVREATGWLTDLIRYKRLPHQAKLLMDAAEKVKETGLPAHAVSDKLLRSVLEDGPLEDDNSMQERWANLLANAATSAPGTVPVAFPKILSELEPKEAALLERLRVTSDPEHYDMKLFGWDDTHDLVDLPELGNLDRLGLLRLVRRTSGTIGGSVSEHEVVGLKFTDLGWAFAAGCSSPS
jgi:hypothetical protein